MTVSTSPILSLSEIPVPTVTHTAAKMTPRGTKGEEERTEPLTERLAERHEAGTLKDASVEHSAEITYQQKIITPRGFRGDYREVTKPFTKETWDRIQSGSIADATIKTEDGQTIVIENGQIVPDSEMALARAASSEAEFVGPPLPEGYNEDGTEIKASSSRAHAEMAEFETGQQLQSPKLTAEDLDNLQETADREAFEETVAEAEKPDAPEGDEVYKIEAGDSLSLIIQDHYDENPDEPMTADEVREHYELIAEYNGIEDVNLIIAGEELKLPPADAMEAVLNGDAESVEAWHTAQQAQYEKDLTEYDASKSDLTTDKPAAGEPEGEATLTDENGNGLSDFIERPEEPAAEEPAERVRDKPVIPGPGSTYA